MHNYVQENLESAFSYGRRMYWRGVRAAIFWYTLAIIVAFASGLAVGEARADGVYIEGGIGVRDQLSRPQSGRTYYEPSMYESKYGQGIHYTPVFVRDFAMYDTNKTENPYGLLRIGYDKSFKLFGVNGNYNVYLEHQSSVATGNDRGLNSAWVSTKFYILGGRQ